MYKCSWCNEEKDGIDVVGIGQDRYVCSKCRYIILSWAYDNDFNPKEQVAIIWSLEDVKDIRPDLTNEQCMEVLVKACVEDHDAEFGVCWETLKDTARFLFGDKK